MKLIIIRQQQKDESNASDELKHLKAISVQLKQSITQHTAGK
jgi:hypothetical protein